MPNHARTRIVITGPLDQRTAVKNLLKGEDNPFDLNRVIPMPATLDVESGTTTDEAMALAAHVDKLEPWQRPLGFGSVTLESYRQKNARYDNFEDDDTLATAMMRQQPGLLELGRQVMLNIKAYGAPTWYEWRYAHWGTKWNTYDHEEVRETSRSLTYVFCTAWGEPRPVFEQLKKMFPGLKFSIHVDGEVDRPYSYVL